MDKITLKKIILDQQNVIKEMKINKRNYLLENNVSYVLVGMRRVGKSTLLYSKVLEYISLGIDWNQIIYINFEDERLSGFKSEDFSDILLLKNEKTNQKTYFFFDEIQNVDNWDKFVRSLVDYNETVYITGSNAKMLSNEVAAKLGGRFIIKNIMPYDFKEYLNASNIFYDESTKTEALINLTIDDYLNYGGLPAILNFSNKREYLKSVYDKLLLNDVLLHNNIRNEKYIKVMVRKMAESVKDELSYTRLNNIMKSIGFLSSKDTIINYIEYLIQANLIFEVKNYYSSFSDKESTPKYYFTDNGILNLFLIDKMGILFENLIAITLKRYEEEYYYLKSTKTGIDIDFYIPSRNTLIQCAFSIEDESVMNREIKDFFKFNKLKNEKSRCIIVTLDNEMIIEKEDYKIEVKKLKNFLLNYL